MRAQQVTLRQVAEAVDASEEPLLFVPRHREALRRPKGMVLWDAAWVGSTLEAIFDERVTQDDAQYDRLVKEEAWLDRPVVEAKLDPPGVLRHSFDYGEMTGIVGIDDPAEDFRPGPRHASIVVTKVQRRLAELEPRCPVPGVRAIVNWDEAPTNKAWTRVKPPAAEREVARTVFGAVCELLQRVAAEPKALEPTQSPYREILLVILSLPFESYRWRECFAEAVAEDGLEEATKRLISVL